MEDVEPQEKNASEILLEKGQGKNVAVIGHFPFTADLSKKARNLWVFEQRQGGLRPEEAREVLPRCEIIGIIGTAFITHTLDDLLRWAEGLIALHAGEPVFFL